MPIIFTATADSRYSFTAQFLRGAGIFAKHAREIEQSTGTTATEDIPSEHRAFVVAAIIHSSAALEAEISEVAEYGPGHHLGSNGLDVLAHDMLSPIAAVVDDQPTLERYQLVLHLLRKPKFAPGHQPLQSVALLIRLRNELVHYKSRFGSKMENIKFLETLRQLNHARPPFVSSHANFFPHHCLSADCAIWSVNTALVFIDAFYGKLDIHSPLDAHRAYILGLLT